MDILLVTLEEVGPRFLLKNQINQVSCLKILVIVFNQSLKVKPEAAYFLPNDGHRTATFIVDMQSSSQVPALVEPLFQWMGANVDVIPVMNFDDLKKGISQSK